MQCRGSLVVIFLALSLLIQISARGQSPLASEGLYCTAGLQPDGYIDFSGLPPAPRIVNLPGNATPSAPVTATLPVKGVAGLMATVTIPALLNTNAGSNPAYSVDGGTLQLNGLPVSSSSGTVLTLNFNQPIAGMSLNTETSGRFNYIYTLQVGVPQNGMPTFLSRAEGYTTLLNSPQTQSLQMVGLLDTLFGTASVQFEGDEYSGVTLSNIRIRSSSAPDPATMIPRNGLELWLRADQADNGKWQDQSGRGHDATPSAVAPLLTVGGPHCEPAWQFTGSQFFTFNLPIAGWSEMTVFLVAKAADAQGPSNSFAGNSAISWTGDEPWGGTFVSAYQGNVYARFGTTQSGNTLYYSRPGGGIGQDLTITRAVHDHGTDSLYVNGLAVQTREGKLSVLGGATGEGFIGEGVNDSFFHGEISEILVYDRVLSTEEAAVVESYLRQKYGTQ